MHGSAAETAAAGQDALSCAVYNVQSLYAARDSLTDFYAWCGRPLPAWRFEDYLGWEEQGDGKLAYGLFIQNGRIKGEMKKALRKARP